jgi:pimeloyl-ACP methyl ester carboxylesterase
MHKATRKPPSGATVSVRLELVIAHASHNPSLAQPDSFNRLLLDRLAQSAGSTRGR